LVDISVRAHLCTVLPPPWYEYSTRQQQPQKQHFKTLCSWDDGVRVTIFMVIYIYILEVYICALSVLIFYLPFSFSLKFNFLCLLYVQIPGVKQTNKNEMHPKET
jgi:hypothetical protein